MSSENWAIQLSTRSSNLIIIGTISYRKLIFINCQKSFDDNFDF